MDGGSRVHTETTNASTSFTHLERCIIDHNLGGGIRWTGQLGLIESLWSAWKWSYSDSTEVTRS